MKTVLKYIAIFLIIEAILYWLIVINNQDIERLQIALDTFGAYTVFAGMFLTIINQKI